MTQTMKSVTIPPIGLLLCVLLLVSGCGPSTAGTPHSEKLIITGSSTLAPLISDIAKRFEVKNPRVRVDVQTGGSSRGLQEARSGLADIGMASRALSLEEQDLVGTPIARDGISMILHSSNPIPSLTNEEIIGIYTGEITNWKTVGGPDTDIVVVHKAEGRATLEIFLRYFHLKNEDIQADVIIGDNEHGIKTVIGNPPAIAYVSIGTAEFEAAQGIPLKLLPLDKVPASLLSLRQGTFPLSRPLTLVTTPDPSPLTERFLRFAQSPEVHDLITKHFFTPASS